jgi:hypothetical protein
VLASKETAGSSLRQDDSMHDAKKSTVINVTTNNGLNFDGLDSQNLVPHFLQTIKSWLPQENFGCACLNTCGNVCSTGYARKPRDNNN